MRRQTALWAIAAVLGIVLVAAVTWATSQLTSQRIGLASEPFSAGRLAPPVAEPAVPRRPSRRAPTHKTTSRKHAPTATSPAPTPAGASSTTSPEPRGAEPSGATEATGAGSAPAPRVPGEPAPTVTSTPRATTLSRTGAHDDGSDREGRGGSEASPRESTGRRDD